MLSGFMKINTHAWRKRMLADGIMLAHRGSRHPVGSIKPVCEQVEWISGQMFPDAFQATLS